MRQNARYRAWAEIDRHALLENMEKIRETLPPTTQFMAVVKANAYGHGDKIVCEALYQNGVRWFAVSNLDEAIDVRSYCPEAEIFILGYTPPEFAPILAQYNIIQGVLSREHAEALSAAAATPVRCHMKVDTGMGRIGFQVDDPKELATSLLPLFSLEGLKIEGIYTHFAVADSTRPEDIAFTQRQEDAILAVYDNLSALGHPLEHVHFMNSAATVMRPNPRSTLARVGIILYGLLPNYLEKIPLDLTPVMSLYSVISHVKTVSAGTSISYGRTFQAPTEMKIATVTIGYADGYSRLLSNCGFALVHGKRCPIVGRVCMDQCMFDVSCVENPQPGDIVTLFGEDNGNRITADEVAATYGTIGYEVVCGISKRVPRIPV